MILKQIRSTDGTGTMTYLIADEANKVAAVIDPNIEDTQRISLAAEELGVTIMHVIDTHTHADHVSGAGKLRELLGAQTVMHEKTRDKWKVVDQGEKFGIGHILRPNAEIPIDRYVNDGDTVMVGDVAIEVLYTPGHTDNHLTLKVGNNIFTGDLLLIGQAGRSDLPGGSASEQYASLRDKILTLPDDTRIYPGHDYEENEYALLGDERKNNPFLQKANEEEYLNFVRDFFPPITDVAEGGKAVLQCGTQRVAAPTDATYTQIEPQQLADMITEDSTLFLLDVREPFELQAHGAVPGVINIPTGQVRERMQDIPQATDAPIVCICQSGRRSAEIAHYLTTQGYANIYNLNGGTLGWLQSGVAVGA